MRHLLNAWQALAAKPWAFLLLLVFAAVLHMGTSIGGHFYADDYLQRASVVGSPALEGKGLLAGTEAHSFSSFIVNQFNFFNPDSANYQAIKEFGILPWWSGEEVSLHFFRPLAAATYFIDYSLWPDSPRLMHAINLMWYLLAIAAIYLLYRSLKLDKSTALLALLLVILHASAYQVVTWIASRSMLMVIAIGFFTLYAYHRSVDDKKWYAIALLGLLASLLSAEAGIGICAYLGAYLFTLDNRAWHRRILHLLPFAVLTLVWHFLYQRAGFGAFGVDFYIDPGQEPWVFLQSALYRLPGNFFELVSGVDFISGQVRPDIRQLYFALGGVAALALFLWLLWPQLKQDKRLQFFFLGSCFVLVPGLTIALAPRVMFLPSIGFAVVLATVMLQALRGSLGKARLIAARFILFYSVFVHVFLSLLFGLFMTSSSISQNNDTEKPYGYVDFGVEDYADKRLMIVNSIGPFWLSFAAHQMDFHGEPLPASIRLLAGGFYPLQLSRVSEKTLRLEGLPAIQLDKTPLQDLSDKPEGHFIYLTWQLMGLMRADREAWQLDQCYDFAEASICVSALEQGKPKQLDITLHEDLASYRWVYEDIKSREYKQIELPAIGQTINFEGVFKAVTDAANSQYSAD